MVKQSLGRLWFYLIMVGKRDKTITLFWTWWICVMHSAYVLKKTKIRMMDTFCPYWFAKHRALQLPLRSYLTYNNGKKKLWMKVLSIKGKKVKTFHREKGDRHDQNVTLLILKEIKGSQDVLSLTFFSFFATNPPSKCQKLNFYWWSIINFASIETASFFFSLASAFVSDMTMETGGERRLTPMNDDFLAIFPCGVRLLPKSLSFYQKSIVFALCTHSASPFSFLEITRRNYKWLLTRGIGICREYLQRIK